MQSSLAPRTHFPMTVWQVILVHHWYSVASGPRHRAVTPLRDTETRPRGLYSKPEDAMKRVRRLKESALNHGAEYPIEEIPGGVREDSRHLLPIANCSCDVRPTNHSGFYQCHDAQGKFHFQWAVESEYDNIAYVPGVLIHHITVFHVARLALYGPGGVKKEDGEAGWGSEDWGGDFDSPQSDEETSYNYGEDES